MTQRRQNEGCRKDVGTGVFRDRHGKVIPRSHFEEDPDFDVEISPEEAYAATLRAGVPRDWGLEDELDMEKVRAYLDRD